MKQIANVCLAEGKKTIFLDVTEENTVAHNLYKKLDYIQDKRYMTVIKRMK